MAREMPVAQARFSVIHFEPLEDQATCQRGHMRYPYPFDPVKALHAIVYVADRVQNPTLHSISKVLYFADRVHLGKYGRFILGDSYVAMRNGPVPSHVYDYMKDVRDDRSARSDVDPSEFFSVVGRFRVQSVRKADTGFFSDSEISCLDDSILSYGSLSFAELTDLSHDKAWRSADENDFIDVEKIVVTLPDSDALLEHLNNPCPD